MDALSNEENKAIENGNPVPEYIGKAREGLSEEKIEALKNQAIEVVKQLRDNLQGLILEDRKLAVQLGAKLPGSLNNQAEGVESEQNPAIIEEPKGIEKERISVDLNEKIEEGFIENNNANNAPAVEDKSANGIAHKEI